MNILYINSIRIFISLKLHGGNHFKWHNNFRIWFVDDANEEQWENDIFALLKMLSDLNLILLYMVKKETQGKTKFCFAIFTVPDFQ